MYKNEQSDAGTIAISKVVCFATRYNQGPYGDTLTDPYYSVSTLLLGYYDYYYDSWGQKYVRLYSMYGQNTILDTSFYVYSQYATNSYFDGGTVIGSNAFYIGGDSTWWRFPNFSQFILANYFTVLKMTNTITVKRGTSTTYDFQITVTDDGT